jgi:hypothetical protein
MKDDIMSNINISEYQAPIVVEGSKMTRYNQSEVARLKAQIEAEVQAAQWALYGTALGAAKHQFITSRMERMGILHEELKELVGEEEGIRLLIQVMESTDAIKMQKNQERQ